MWLIYGGMTLTEYLAKENTRQAEFASRIKMSPAYVSMICSGQVWPSREVVARIAKETGGKVTANDFMKPMKAAQ